MKKALAATLLVTFVAGAWAVPIWSDDFDSYADQAAFDAVYTQIYPETPLVLDQTVGYSDGQSVNPTGPNESSTRRAYVNLGGEFAGSDANPLVFEFMVQMSDAIDWWGREYIEIRGYEGAGYGDGDLQELIALGATSSGVNTSKYNARILSGENWVDLQSDRSTEWVKLGAMLKTDTIELYVNDVLEYTGARAAGVTIDSVVIGSGLSSRVDFHFDDLNITPEPASLVLLALGMLIRRR